MPGLSGKQRVRCYNVTLFRIVLTLSKYSNKSQKWEAKYEETHQTDSL